MVGMSESGVRNLIKRGTLRTVQLDGRTRLARVHSICRPGASAGAGVIRGFRTAYPAR
jgi:ribosomal protein L19E